MLLLCVLLSCHLLRPKRAEVLGRREEHHLLEEREPELSRRLGPHLYRVDLSGRMDTNDAAGGTTKPV